MATQRDSLIAKNKKAYHDYFIDETFEAGIELTGTEVKSLRENHASLRECFASVRDGEMWLHGVHIAPYSHGNRENVEVDRKRRLLLHKKEIRYLQAKVKESGYTLIPVSMYFSPTNLVKVELGLARGKKAYDKRDTLAARDQARDTDRALRERQKGQ